MLKNLFYLSAASVGRLKIPHTRFITSKSQAADPFSLNLLL